MTSIDTDCDIFSNILSKKIVRPYMYFVISLRFPIRLRLFLELLQHPSGISFTIIYEHVIIIQLCMIRSIGWAEMSMSFCAVMARVLVVAMCTLSFDCLSFARSARTWRLTDTTIFV